MNRGHEAIKIIHVSEEEIGFDSQNITIRKEHDKGKLSRSKIVLLIIILIVTLSGYAYLDQQQLHPQNQKQQRQQSTFNTLNHSNMQQKKDVVNQNSQQTFQSRNQQQINQQDNKDIAQEQQDINPTLEQETDHPYNELIINNNGKPKYKQFPNRAISSYAIKRKNGLQQIIAGFKKQDQQSLKKHLIFYNITIEQFIRAMLLTQNAPLYALPTKSPVQEVKLQQLDKQEHRYFERKYKIDSYQQLPMCIVVPTYKNYKRFRYYFNLHTILQQHYSNYHVVIVDDASPDETVKSLEEEIRVNSYIREKVTLVKNSKRQHHMANFYNGIHQHCKKGEILVTVDGDDELVGRYVLKVINAQYHRSKSLVIYSNHIQSRREVVFDIGISNAYPQQVKQNNLYRQKAHLYSHLRTTWVDLFLLIKESDLKDNAGNWYTNAVDNAMFYPIFEMSCGEVEYLSEILYKYNTFTGQNVDNLPYWMRKQTNDDINSKQKYKCLKYWNRPVYDKIKDYIS